MPRKPSSSSSSSSAASSLDRTLRTQLLRILEGEGAHVSFQEAVHAMPYPLQGRKVKGVPWTAWSLLEHLRIAQWDMLRFSSDPAHRSPSFPSGYWPDSPSPPDRGAWERSARSFRRDLRAFIARVGDRKIDLAAPVPDAQGPPLLRELLLVTHHLSYHVGQLVVLRRLLGAWKD